MLSDDSEEQGGGGLSGLFGQVMRFGIVGGGGTITNLVIFYLLADRAGWQPQLVSAFAFLVAVSQNYLLNHLWTFRSQHGGVKPNWKKYLSFVSVSLGGLAINLLVLSIVLAFWKDIPLRTYAQAIGILSGLIVNFLGSRFLVFRKPPSD